MAYCLHPREEPAEGLKRIAEEQLARAIESAVHLEMDRDEAVHDVRKRMKKVRAVLRMVRGEMGKDVYTRENACFRGIAKQLAELRETTALVAAVEKLTLRFADEARAEALKRVLAGLENHRDEVRKEDMGEKNALENVLEELRQARKRVKDWSFKKHGFSLMAKGIRRVYRRGRRGLKNAQDSPGDENFHEWRRYAKYLWYHASILEASWPAMMAPFIAEAGRLGDMLGEDHDLTDVRGLLLKKPEMAGGRSECEVVLELISQCQLALRKAVLPLGKRIYAEKPGAFVARLETCWNVAHESESG